MEENPPPKLTKRSTSQVLLGRQPFRFKSWLAILSGQAAREGYLAAIDQGVISLSNFVATIILARNVDPTQLGIYGVGFVTLRLVRSIQDGIVVQPLNVFGAGMDEEHFSRYATSTSLIQIALAVLTAALVAISGWLFTALGNDIAGPTLFSLWFPFVTWQLQEYVRRMLYTRGYVLSAVINTIISNGVRLALMLVWVKQGRLSGITGLEAIGWGALAALIPGAWFTRRYWRRNFESLKATWNQNWRFGHYILGGTIANWVSVEFYPVLTAGMISFAAAGAYRALQNIVAPIHSILRAFDTFLTPRSSRIYAQTGVNGLMRTMKLAYIFAGIPTLGFLLIAILFPEMLLELLYGDTYLAYSQGMVLMALFYGLWFAYWPLQIGLKAVHLSRPIFIANIAAIILMFTAGIGMIQRWGVYGTIGGQALNALVINIILWFSWLTWRRAAK